MRLKSPSMRLAYAIYAALALLMLGILGWATVASLRLDRAERLMHLQRERARAIRLAMYRMETFANAKLAGEFHRSSADYSPLYFPSPDEVRIHTGEMLSAGFIVRPSPLLLRPSREPCVRLHFQASLRGGYRSPEVIPQEARSWTDFDDAYDASIRERFAATLNSLEYAYTVDELTRAYHEAREQAGGESGDGGGSTAVAAAPAEAGKSAEESDYSRRKQRANLTQRARSPTVDCAPQRLAVANWHTPEELTDAEFANEQVPSDDEIGITCDERMLPVWLRFANRPVPDLAFLRAVYADGEPTLQGFIIDWPKFHNGLLAEIRDLFPQATIERLDGSSRPKDETAFGFIPARLETNTPDPVVAAVAWNTTHSFLLVGWTASIILLVAFGLGIRSLIALSERRSQFAYAVTHELRTPLTTFRLYTDMLAQGMVDERNRQSYLDTLNDESRRLANLVSGVLEYSRIENDSVPINREPVVVSTLLDDIRESYASQCQQAGVQLHVDAGTVGPDAVCTDRRLAAQIIGNLVDNACKYGRHGAQPTISITAERDDGLYHFDVVDNGPGIPARLRASVFKPYERGDSESTPATGGIGLGLALSRSWAKLLGGHLELVPRTRGARFRLTLPAEPAS